MVLVDTSALFALLDGDQPANPAATNALRDLADSTLVTHGYVVAEAVALVRRRLGPAATLDLIDRLLTPIHVHAVDDELHQLALEDFRATGATGPSLVDRTSFAFMRREKITTAFAVDRDFLAAGFRVVPEPSPEAAEVNRAAQP